MNPPRLLNKPDPPQSETPQTRRVTQTSHTNDPVSTGDVHFRTGYGEFAVLLDLSGDKNAAMKWAAEWLPQTTVKPLNKARLKWASKRQALAQVRAFKPKVFAVFTRDISMQSGLGALMLFAIAAGANKVVIGDRQGRLASRGILSVVLGQAPRFLLELVAGYGLIIPLSALLTLALRLSLVFRAPVRASRDTNGGDGQRHSFTTLYLRGTPASAVEGGMRTHVAGFASGAAALGHQLKFCTSDTRGDDDSATIPPSRLFSATKALFEIWNNLVFTVKTIRRLSS
ncbi:MAG: hypothetical protein WAV20_12105, partial [Blastocatellia bacterium]